MFPTTNTQWNLSYSHLRPYIGTNVCQKNGRVEVQVLSSSDFEIRISFRNKNARKSLSSYSMPDILFYRAVDVTCVPDVDNTKEFIDHIIKKKLEYENRGMFTGHYLILTPPRFHAIWRIPL